MRTTLSGGEQSSDVPTGTVESWLWTEPEDGVDALPVVTESETLPLDKLSFRDAERLFLRLLESEVDVTYAKSYGVVGQAQGGIDVYGRLRTPDPAVGAQPSGSGRHYVALQSKRVKTVTPADISNAVTKFLDGQWSAQSKQFYYATTFDFRKRDLDKAVRDATDLLDDQGVEFIPWDGERVNELLRSQPRLVDRFFGRHWVQPFCGADAALNLPHTRLNPTEANQLKGGLRALYRAAFNAFASLRPSAPEESFVILDVRPRSNNPSGQLDEARGLRTEGSAGLHDFSAGDDSEPQSESRTTTSRLRRPRPSLREVGGLLDDRSNVRVLTDMAPVDAWLAEGERNILFGVPGAGKSSLLRFVATDLLAPEPDSIALQRAYGDRLPLWLPFGFLCRHLDENGSNSLTSAVHAWLASQARPDLSPLVDAALEDDRLLLLIDGIDEWTTEATANEALGKVETLVGATKAAVIMTSRPYALSRLPLNLGWRRADLAPLDPAQRRAIAAMYLVPANSEPVTTETGGSGQSGSNRAPWSAAAVEPFLAQIDAVSELQAFSRTPLLLSLLARTWQGEPLPPRRFDLYDLVVKMLIDTHPKMRARASKATPQALTANDFQTLVQGVAFRLKADKTPQPTPYKVMQNAFEVVLSDPEVLGYSPAEARSVAAEALKMAEDEFGILVPQGAKQVGFVHRVIGDHLAGRHLAELSQEKQSITFADHHRDASWTDVLLAALNAQPNKQTVANALDNLISELDGNPPVPWPHDVLNHQDTWRFIAAALAADASLAPSKVQKLINVIVAEVENSASLTYRADLVTSLVQASPTPGYWRHLKPTFNRWLDATRPDPGAAIYALRQLPSSYDARIREIAFHTLRHEDGGVRSSAVDIIATRFGNSRGPDPDTTASVQQALLQVINDGPDTATQCAALLALLEGWSNDPATLDAIAWARQNPKTNLRTAALYAVAQGDPKSPLSKLFTPEELAFVLDYLHKERYIEDHDWTGLSSHLVMRAVTESSQKYKVALAQFAASTLRQNPMRDGNRSMCWQLACGPLADQPVLQDWVIDELCSTSERFPLILYDLTKMPPEWTGLRPLRDAISNRIDELVDMPWHRNISLTRFLDDERARAALLAAIDKPRPAAAARELVDRFGTNPAVIAALDKRFANDETAATLAGIAMQHLGSAEGFARNYELLKAHNAKEPTSASELQVVLARTVAHNWYQLKQAVAGEESPFDVSDAQAILDAYDDDAVGATCMAVPTRRGLGWHIAEIINTWPAQAIDYTIAELRSNHHITQGLDDPIHSVAISAHATKPSPRSDEVLDLALDLLTPLPASLREVLAFELARAPITPAQLIDVTKAWKNDPDDGVRRITAVGITEAIQRHQRLDDVPSSEMAQWRELVREDLRAYGPHLDEDRQIAWTCMLLLDAPELLDGVRETINEPKRPGVRLTDIYGNPDALLATLIARNWTKLLPHLDDDPIAQLSGVRPKDGGGENLAALGALLVSPTSPGIANLLSEGIATEAADSGDSATLRLIESTPAGIDHLIKFSGATTENFRRVIAASVAHSTSGDRRGIYDHWAFRKLTAPWEILDADLESIFREAMIPKEPAPGSPRSRSDVVSAAHDLLFPHSAKAKERLRNLTDWFEQPEEGRGPVAPTSWIEATALTFNVTPAGDLPAYVERLFDLRRLEVAREPLWTFTEPLIHRITHDPIAAHALNDALDGRDVAIESPLFEQVSISPGIKPANAARRVFVIARTLKAAGHLDASALEVAFEVLRKADPRTTVADPFAGAIGPLRTLGVALADGISK